MNILNDSASSEDERSSAILISRSRTLADFEGNEEKIRRSSSSSGGEGFSELEEELSALEKEALEKFDVQKLNASLVRADPQDSSPILGQLRALINEPEFSDITLFGEGQEIKCHKVILALRCQHFRDIFRTNKAAKNLKTKLKFKVLTALVEYLYTDSFNVEDDWVEELYAVSQVYELPELTTLCKAKMEKLGKVSNVVLSKNLSRVKTISQFETSNMRNSRRTLASQLVNTEKEYIDSLALINNEFMEPLRKLSTEKQSVVSSEELKDLFSYWDVIYKCHLRLYTVMEERLKKWDIKPEIGDIFSEKSAFIKLYIHYASNFDRSLVAQRQVRARNAKFREFMTTREALLKGQSIESYLTIPLQRITKYATLFQDLLKNTVKSHNDYNSLGQALQTMKDLIAYINENKVDIEEVQKILFIQEKMTNWPHDQQLVKPKRRLLKEGILYCNKDKLTAFLFTDALLFVKTKSKDKWKCKILVHLETSSLSINNDPHERHHFELIALGIGSLKLTALPEEKETWFQSLADATDRAHQVLLGSAITTSANRSTSPQIQERMLPKRSELAIQIVNEEKEYISSLQIAVETFLVPIQEGLKTGYPILTEAECTSIFGNIDKIYKCHQSFLDSLEKKVENWDNASTIGDLFLEQVANCLGLYSTYAITFPTASTLLEDKMRNSVHFTTFLVQRETDNKVLLPDLLEKPLKKLSGYYLSMQEFLQYTPPTHPDHGFLKVSIARLKEQLDRYHLEKLNEISPKKTNTIYHHTVGRKSISETPGIKLKSPSLDSLFSQTKDSKRKQQLATGRW